jgi:hypothetical protein
VDVAALVFGAIGLAAVVAIVVAAQRAGVRRLAKLDAARSGWATMRPLIARHLDHDSYRTSDNDGRRLLDFDGPVGRVVSEQRPHRVREWALLLPDPDLHAVNRLIDAQMEVIGSGMRLDGAVIRAVRTRARTTAEQRLMASACRRWAVGWDEERIVEWLVDPELSEDRRAALRATVATAVSLVEEGGILHEHVDEYVTCLQEADVAYREARQLLRG